MENFAIQLFEQTQVRVIWNEEEEKYYFSVVDVIRILTESADYQSARKYWKVLKGRLKKEGNESVTNCYQLKLPSSSLPSVHPTTYAPLKKPRRKNFRTTAVKMKNNMNEQPEHTCQVFHLDLFGSREDKYEFLQSHRLDEIDWNELHPEEPYHFFMPKDFSMKEEYEKGFKLDELMENFSSGVKTANDNGLVSFLPYNSTFNRPYFFRPLDNRFINYDLSKVSRSRYEIMKHLDRRENSCILACKQAVTEKFGYFVSKGITDINYTGTAGQYGAGLVFPLYLYSEDGEERKANLNADIMRKIEQCVVGNASERCTSDSTTQRSEALPTINPVNIFDYIYAVLHSPTYRAKYKEFLKIDFPRIPYPESAEEYHRLAAIGCQLRKLHLMEEVPPTQHAQFNNPGSNMVDKLEYKNGNIWINKEQCFKDVPETAWNFFIGGYQPAQKWLKDRKGRTLTFDDIAHYRKIITVLLETDRLMKQIVVE